MQEHYIPWIKVRDLASKGSSHMVGGVKIDRTHHLISTAEYRAFLVAEQDPTVIDIREQYPLHPREETAMIAAEFGYSRPVCPFTQELLVFTTDLLLTKIDSSGAEYLTAVSIKYLSELEEAQRSSAGVKIFQRLEIEREYWKRRGVASELVIAEDLSQVETENLLMLRGFSQIKASLCDSDFFVRTRQLIANTRTGEVPLRRVIKSVASALRLPYMDSKALLMHMLWRNLLSFDIRSEKINLDMPLKIKVHTTEL